MSEKFSVEIDSDISSPKTYILLYNFYNPVIINYYRDLVDVKDMVSTKVILK